MLFVVVAASRLESALLPDQPLASDPHAVPLQPSNTLPVHWTRPAVAPVQPVEVLPNQ
jgi:hypothetical protein